VDAKAGKAGEAGAEGDKPADPEEALMADMAALKDKMAREAKREKRKRREMKIKAKLRAAQAVQSEGLGEDPHQVGLGVFVCGYLRGCDAFGVRERPGSRAEAAEARVGTHDRSLRNMPSGS
jgi:hypothetical protein